MSVKPLRVHDLPEEAERIKQETERLLTELNGRRPRGAILIRARDLRSRSKALGRTIDRLLCEEMAVELAFRERTGRNIKDGDEITPEDERRSAQIIAGFRLDDGY